MISTIPASTAIGQTVDAMVDGKPERVTLLGTELVRIEPGGVCRIV